MKTLSSAVAILIELNHTEVFVLAEVNGLYFTSLPHDIRMSNNQLYISDGGLTGVDAPRQTSVVDREAYKVSFADPNGTFRSMFDAGIVGKKVAVTMGFINTSGAAMNGADGVSVTVGSPFKDMRDTVNVYAGVVDTTSIDIDAKEETWSAVIENSSPMGALDMRNTFMTSKDAMRAANPLDSSFDMVHVGSGAEVLKWGKS